MTVTIIDSNPTNTTVEYAILPIVDNDENIIDQSVETTQDDFDVVFASATKITATMHPTSQFDDVIYIIDRTKKIPNIKTLSRKYPYW